MKYGKWLVAVAVLPTLLTACSTGGKKSNLSTTASFIPTAYTQRVACQTIPLATAQQVMHEPRLIVSDYLGVESKVSSDCIYFVKDDSYSRLDIHVQAQTAAQFEAQYQTDKQGIEDYVKAHPSSPAVVQQFTAPGTPQVQGAQGAFYMKNRQGHQHLFVHMGDRTVIFGLYPYSQDVVLALAQQAIANLPNIHAVS